MKLQLIFLLVFYFGNFGLGLARRIELLHFNTPHKVPTSEFIPVYSAVEDYDPVPYSDTNLKGGELVLLESIDNKNIKKEELRSFSSLSSIETETAVNNYEPLEIVEEIEGRNFQPLVAAAPELRNFQSLPTIATPDMQNLPNFPSAQSAQLTNFGLPSIAGSALKNFQTTKKEDTSSGRTLKHFLLLRSLLGAGNGGGQITDPGNGFGGIIVPVFVNNPVNVSNTNNNTLTNTPAGGGGDGGGDDGGDGGSNDDPNVGLRVNYIGIPQTQQFPMPMQMPTQVYQQPTPVYHQRQAIRTAQPGYAYTILNMPGVSSFMPYSLTQFQSPVNRNNGDAKRRRTPSKNQNPWSAFANNLRGWQFS